MTVIDYTKLAAPSYATKAPPKPAWEDPAQALPWPSQDVGTVGPVSAEYAYRCIMAFAEVAGLSFDEARAQHLRSMARQHRSRKNARLIAEHVRMVEGF